MTSSTGLNPSVEISEDCRHFAAELEVFKGSGCGGVMLGGDACSSMLANWRLVGVSGILEEQGRGTAFLTAVEIEGSGAGKKWTLINW